MALDTKIADGWHTLTGIGETTVEDEWNGWTADAVVFQLDGKNYIAYTDKEDGYRSYGRLLETDERPQMTFVPQRVRTYVKEVDTYDETGYWPIKLTVLHVVNADDEDILEIGTDNSDRWYPMAIFHWHPENLPVNKAKSNEN